MSQRESRREGGRRRIFRFIFVLHFYAFLALLSLLFVLAGGGLVAWKVPAARNRVHSALAALYLRRIAPHLPFVIEKVQVQAQWSSFFQLVRGGGKLAEVDLDLDWAGWKLRLAGPVELAYDHKEPETHIDVAYDARVTATPPGKRVNSLPQIPLRISFRAAENLSHLDSLKLATSMAQLQLPEPGIYARDLDARASWSQDATESGNGSASIHLSARELTLPGRGMVVFDPNLAAIGPLRLMPVTAGGIGVDLSASGARATVNGEALNIPLARLPVHATLSLPDPARSDSGTSFSVTAGSQAAPDLTMAGLLESRNGAPSAVTLRWKTHPMTLREAIAAVRGVRGDLPFLRSLKWLRKLSGRLATSGSAQLALPLTPLALADPRNRLDADLRLSRLGFEWPGRYLAVSGLDLDLPLSNRKGLNGSLSIRNLLFRRFKARLPSTRIQVLPLDAAGRKWRVHLGDSRSRIPLEIAGVPLRIGALDGTLAPGKEASESSDYDLETSFKLPATDAGLLGHLLCLKPDHVPPAWVKIDFPDVELQPGSVDPDGKVELRLFDGKAEVSNIAFYDLDTKVPETDFDLDIDGVRLDQLGSWSGFGEMDGTLHSYAHDVVMQAWLPTQYDFRFEVLPFSRPKVVFSPEAMKNVARMVAADSIDRLPGIVQWLAFGWPHRIFGGYDVYFFGATLFSRDGKILFSVLDPPELPSTLTREERRSLLWKQKQNHYILYGQWFRIPLNAPYYPLVVSATAVSDYVHSMVEKFLELSQARKDRIENQELAALVKRTGSIEKAKEEIWHEEHELDCAPPAL